MKEHINKSLQSIKGLVGKSFLYDVFKTFLAVFLAFWVNEWKNDRQLQFSERTALQEIKKELSLDLRDIRENIQGHREGVRAVRYFFNLLQGKPEAEDSLFLRYNFLHREFISIQHSAAYESVKAQGLHLIRDDSLRNELVNLFDFTFESIEKIEEDYDAHDFVKLYYHPMTNVLAPFMAVEPSGALKFRRPISEMPEKDKQLMLLWLQRLHVDRNFMISAYKEAEQHVLKLQAHIDQYLVL